jgi:hypothetical protein
MNDMMIPYPEMTYDQIEQVIVNLRNILDLADAAFRHGRPRGAAEQWPTPEEPIRDLVDRGYLTEDGFEWTKKAEQIVLDAMKHLSNTQVYVAELKRRGITEESAEAEAVWVAVQKAALDEEMKLLELVDFDSEPMFADARKRIAELIGDRAPQPDNT